MSQEAAQSPGAVGHVQLLLEIPRIQLIRRVTAGDLAFSAKQFVHWSVAAVSCDWFLLKRYVRLASITGNHAGLWSAIIAIVYIATYQLETFLL